MSHHLRDSNLKNDCKCCEYWLNLSTWIVKCSHFLCGDWLVFANTAQCVSLHERWHTRWESYCNHNENMLRFPEFLHDVYIVNVFPCNIVLINVNEYEYTEMWIGCTLHATHAHLDNLLKVVFFLFVHWKMLTKVGICTHKQIKASGPKSPRAEVPMLLFVWRCAVLVCCVRDGSIPFTQVSTMYNIVRIAHMMVPLCSWADAECKTAAVRGGTRRLPPQRKKSRSHRRH